MIDLTFGTVVYHVAHPTIKGVVVQHPLDNRCTVYFESALRFNLRQVTRLHLWICDTDLLHPTSEEAVANDKFKEKDETLAVRGDPLFQRLLKG